MWAGVIMFLILSSVPAFGASDDSSFIKNLSKRGLVIENKTTDYVVVIDQTGLNNAIIRVKDRAAYETLLNNLARLQADDVSKINKLKDTVATEKNNEQKIEGKVPAKFFGLIPTYITKHYTISSDGSLVEKRNMFHRFFKIQNSAQEAG